MESRAGLRVARPGPRRGRDPDRDRARRALDRDLGRPFFGGTVYAFRDLTDARQLEEIKADFIATASHELRTPLAAVYGAAQTLLRHDFALDETGRERFVSLIADESERLGRIVNEILLANQLDAGRLDIEFEPFDAGDLVERVVEATRVYAPPSVIDRGSRPATDLPRGRRRPRQGPPGARQPRRERDQVLPGRRPGRGRGRGARRRRSASTSGTRASAFRPRSRSAIFEKFYRADPQMITRRRRDRPRALHLQGAVGRMGGRIWVESERGARAPPSSSSCRPPRCSRTGPLSPGGYNQGTDIRGRPGFDVVGSPAELQAEVPGRPRKTTGNKRKCEGQLRTRTRCLTSSEARRSELGPWLG